MEWEEMRQEKCVKSRKGALKFRKMPQYKREIYNNIRTRKQYIHTHTTTYTCFD